MTTNKIPNNTITRDLRELDNNTGNLYESLVIISKRADQLNKDLKESIHRDLSTFKNSEDSLEEVLENKEQTEVAKYYERLPKPSLVAVNEFLEDKVYYRIPEDKNDIQDESIQ